MKKFVLLLLLFVYTPFACMAQGSVMAIAPGNAGANNTYNIIKDYKNHSTILSSIAVDYNTTVFGFQYHNNLHTIDKTILSDYYIYDFEISNDSVFFCGEDIVNHRGVVGFFDINGFFFGNDSATIYHSFKVEEGRVLSLKRITTYIDLINRRHIVSIGSASHSRGLTNSCIVDVYTNLMGNFTSYQSGVVPWEDDETFVDVEHVDEYVVTAGYTADSKLSIRVYEQYDLFWVGGPQEYRHTFDASYYNSRQWTCDNVVIAPTIDHKFITATTWRLPSAPSPEVNRLHLAEYDIPTLIANSSAGMTKSNDMLIDSCAEIATVYQLVHNIKKKNIGLLFQGDRTAFGGIKNSFFFEIKRDLSSIVTGMIAMNNDELCPDSRLQSLDTYYSNNNYIMLGYCERAITPFHEFKFHIEKSGQQSLCCPPANATLQTLEPLDCRPKKSKITSYQNFLTSKKEKGNRAIYGVTIKCIEQ